MVALRAAATGHVKAMHDPTEGGVLAGLLEMAMAAGRGILVFADQVPVLPETRQVCSALGLDPLGLLASGSLLIGLAPAKTGEVEAVLRAGGTPTTVVAQILPCDQGYWLRRGGNTQVLEFPARDELAKLF